MSTEEDPLLESSGGLVIEEERPWWKSPFLWMALSILAVCTLTLGGAAYWLTEKNRPKYHNEVILIRHGEKPKKANNPGLSKKGKKRAECLREIMGPNSTYNIGLIIAEGYNAETGQRARPFYTVQPLAHDLGLTVDVSCSRDDFGCVRRRVQKFSEKSSKAVLICWKHSYLNNLARTLGAGDVAPYPDKRYDIIWEMRNQTIQRKHSESCKGIDDDLPSEDDDPDLFW